MTDFPTTRISLIAAAQGPSREALAELCQIYWRPLFVFVKHSGYGEDDARDLTQGFIARMIEKDVLRHFSAERGRFRSFLLASLKHFLLNQHDAAHALKRGGGAEHIPIEDAPAVPDAHTPERHFERQWALGLLARVTERLRQEAEASAKLGQFERLKDCLTGDSAPYAALAAEWGSSEGAVKSAVHRLRQRYKEVLREEVSRTVATPEEVGDEIRYLFAAVRA